MTLPTPLAPLGQYRQFIRYLLVPTIDKQGRPKTDKQPIHWQHGYRVDLTNAEAHCSYDEAAASPHGHGVGFVFSDADPFWFLDVDHALQPDGTWRPLVPWLYAELPGVAWEISQSGTGLHAFGRGAYPDGLKVKNSEQGVELYRSGRFVALTLNIWGDGGSADTVSTGIAGVASALFAPQTIAADDLQGWTTEAAPGYDSDLEDDDELLRRMLKPSTADMLGSRDGSARRWTAQQLWDGIDAGDMQSEADGALAAYLAFWTGKNCERIERLMRQSGMVREKWDTHRTYLYLTITRACSAVQRIATPLPQTERIAVSPVDGDVATAREFVLSNEMLLDKGNHLTVEAWIKTLNYEIYYDEFADVIMIGDDKLTDNMERDAWLRCREQSSLKFPKELFADVLRDVAYRNRRHPLREWLDTVQPTWDGTARLDSWLSTYLGVESNPYVAAIGAIFLTAAVRRARQPGAKFDEMIVLEGPEGIDKSSAIAALCERRDWFSDDVHIGMTSKELLEVTDGKWIVEAPEMITARGAAVEHMKAMLARQFDRARKAFDRNATERGRQWVPFSTTNETNYLGGRTGNRRIWPVRVGTVDLAGIVRDRAQLWAEAAQREAAGASIRLPRELWAVAADEQAERMSEDPIEDALAVHLGGLTGRIKGVEVMKVLGLPVDRQQRLTRSVGDAMRALGWHNKSIWVNGVKCRYYVREYPEPELSFVAGVIINAPAKLTIVK